MERNDFVPEEQAVREITVYNTVGSCEVTLKSKATTVGELKKELDAKGIQHRDMKMVIGETQDELEKDSEILLGTEFSLFLTPIKVKSGK